MKCAVERCEESRVQRGLCSRCYHAYWREANRERHLANQRRWYEANRDRVLASVKASVARDPERARARVEAWHLQNPERVAENGRRSYEANKETIKARTRAWQRANPDRVKETRRRREAALTEAERERRRAKRSAWKKRNHAKVNISTQRRRARLAGTRSDFTKVQWDAILLEQAGRCHYCGVEAQMEIEHRIPISRGGEHTAANIVGACAPCNRAKNARTDTEFLLARNLAASANHPRAKERV